MADLTDEWRTAFWDTIQDYKNSNSLRDAALSGKLGLWTQEMTTVVVSAMGQMGWKAAAKSHRLDLLPEARSEYLGIDVMGFSDEGGRWSFPAAAVELENSKKDDRIAYSLWKVLCVRADLRAVFCYRKEPGDASALKHYLQESVVKSIRVNSRAVMEGETVLVIGSRNEAETFPYGFFKWWKLDSNTGTFEAF